MIRAALALGLLAGSAGAETLRIGASPAYPPYLSLDAAGQHIGIDADIVRALCVRGGYDCVWVDIDVPGLIPALMAGRIDVVTGGIGNSPDREALVDFTCPYHVTEDAYGTFWAADGQTDPEAGRIAVTAGSLHEKAMLAAGRDVIAVPGNAAAIDTVLSGGAEVYFGSAGVVSAHPNRDLFHYRGDHPIESTGAALAVSEEQPELRDALNDLLAEISADGTLANLQKQWLGVDQGDIIATCQGGDLLS